MLQGSDLHRYERTTEKNPVLFQTATCPTGLGNKKTESRLPHHMKTSSVRTKGSRRGNQMEKRKQNRVVGAEKKRDKKRKAVAEDIFCFHSVCMLMFIYSNTWEKGITEGLWSIWVHCDPLQKVQTWSSALLLLAKGCRDSHVFSGGKQHHLCLHIQQGYASFYQTVPGLGFSSIAGN